jgi:VWFA-related protein
MGRRTSSDLARRLGLFLALCLIPSVQAQQKEKPKLKNFGESLKRIKWDPEKNAAVEVKSPRPSNASPAGDYDVVRVETSLVSDDLLVLDARGNPVTGLTAKDFVVTEDGTAQQVGMFSLGDDVNVPRSIVLIIDYHEAQLPFLRSSVVAAKTLIDKLAPKDRMAIVTDDIELLAGYSNNKQRLKDTLDELVKRPKYNPEAFLEGRTSIRWGRGFVYSALMAVLKEAFDDEDQRPIIIFQTDGEEAYLLKNPIVVASVPPGLPPDLTPQAERFLERHRKFKERNKREFSLNDVYQAAEKARATIYTVVPGYQLLGSSDKESIERMRAYEGTGVSYLGVATNHTADRLKRIPDETIRFEAQQKKKTQSALAVLSTITGGWIEFLNQPAQADEIYSRVFSDINRRYVVSYYPTNKERDGQRRKVTISVREHPEYLVMGRKAYYAPGAEQ